MKRFLFIKRQRGASAVEAALVLPLLIVILFGIIEFSIVLYDQAMVTRWAREGARYGTMWAPTTPTNYRYTDTQIQSYITTGLGNQLISFSNNDQPIVVTNQCVNPNDILTVTVTYPYSFLLLPNFVNQLTGKITLISVARMNCEH